MEDSLSVLCLYSQRFQTKMAAVEFQSFIVLKFFWFHFLFSSSAPLKSCISNSHWQPCSGGESSVIWRNQESRQNLVACRALPTLSKSLDQTQRRSLSFLDVGGQIQTTSLECRGGSFPVYNTLTSQRNPQIRIKRGLEIRYRKVMSPLLVLLHAVHPLLSLSLCYSIFFPWDLVARAQG